MMGETWIKTDNLCRYYQRGTHEVRAIDKVALKIGQGEFVAVVGKSGSGKSTLLNLIAGLDTPTAGQVVVDGRDLGELSRRQLAAYRAQMVGMIFQSFNLLAYRPALQNVELALYFTDLPRHQRRAQAREVLAHLGLSERETHLPADLSGGEQQRLAIARAIVKRPRLLLADEPTGNLDEENSNLIADLLAELHRDGLTVLMVTHDQELAHRYAQRIVRMDYGRIVGDEAIGAGGRSR
ncbi:MAG: ABC transporter ATP-binding protein [bacterium]